MGDPSPRRITLSEARSRLYRRRSLQVNSHFQHFSRSTRFSQFCAARISTFCKTSSKIRDFQEILTFFLQIFKNFKNFKNFESFENFENFLKIVENFLQNFEFRAVQKCANPVDFEKCCKMTIWWPKSALIQPRTSLGKSDVSWRSGCVAGGCVCERER